jgi:predicted RNA-binding Zn-ribbon protein involved in translation (DUF1610 family)
MIIIYGLYRFAGRRVAYRQDYCLPCEAERVTEQIRSFFVGHLYGIPLLPLGFYREWSCPACGRNPARRVRTSRNLVRVFTVVVGLVAAMVTAAVVVDHSHPDVGILLLVALGIWGLTGGLIYIERQMMRPAVDRAAELARIQPASVTTCALCSGALQHRQDGRRVVHHCPACKADRLAA